MTAKSFDPNVDYQRSRLAHTKLKFESLNLPNLAGKSFLDLGCNSGAFCSIALEQGASHVAGVDIDPRLVEIARHSIPNGEFFVSAFEDMDLHDHTFDVITIASAIHYSRDFLLVANKIMGMLAPGGILAVEGGLFDPLGATRLNSPVPNWRKIGDHCRHLSMKFLSEVLFPSSQVTLVGPSLQQGGDNLSRFAVHVTKAKAEMTLKKRRATVDLEAFARALAVSFDTVQSEYPISNYLSEVSKAAILGIANFDPILASKPKLIEIIADEIHFCTSDWAASVEIMDGYGTNAGRNIVELLRAKGAKASLVRGF